MARSLKIGFIIEQPEQVEAWYYETIKQVIQQGHAVYFILVVQPASKQRLPFFYNWFGKFEDKWFSNNDAKKLERIDHYFTEFNYIRLTISNSALIDDFQSLMQLKLDVLYTINFLNLRLEQLSTVASYGLWTIGFGKDDYLKKNLPAFWETMDDNPVTGSSLLIKKDSKIYVAYEGTTRTIPYSVKNNLNSIAWKSSSYLLHRLVTLRNNETNFLSQLPVTNDIQFIQNTVPGNFQMAKMFIWNIAGYFKYKFSSLKNNKRFTLLYSFKKFNVNEINSYSFTPLKVPDATFYADPFVIEKDGCHYIFFEEMVASESRAHISVIVVNKDKTISSPQMVLQKPYHLSYPYVFMHEGMYYMIPETASNKTVELYRAEEFPYKWNFVMNLMENVVMLDVTLCLSNNKWWLFANSHHHPFVSTNDQLFLYYSDELFSTNWVSHPANPIATHISNCRPAGRIFKQGDFFYRPAQNNASQQYGYGLNINQIEILNEMDYKERNILSLDINALGLKACHHLDFSNELVVIDGIVA